MKIITGHTPDRSGERYQRAIIEPGYARPSRLVWYMNPGYVGRLHLAGWQNTPVPVNLFPYCETASCMQQPIFTIC